MNILRYAFLGNDIMFWYLLLSQESWLSSLYLMDHMLTFIMKGGWNSWTGNTVPCTSSMAFLELQMYSVHPRFLSPLALTDLASLSLSL